MASDCCMWQAWSVVNCLTLTLSHQGRVDSGAWRSLTLKRGNAIIARL